MAKRKPIDNPPEAEIRWGEAIVQLHRAIGRIDIVALRRVIKSRRRSPIGELGPEIVTALYEAIAAYVRAGAEISSESLRAQKLAAAADGEAQ